MIPLILVGILSAILRFVLTPQLESENTWVVIALCALIVLLGGFVLFRMAKLIENTTEVLSKRTGLAGGFLQSLGTAFPDMVIGIVAALSSLGVINTDYTLAINFAIIAAATTFGSNIYNIGHAAWCILRQNLANKLQKDVLMFPGLKFGGKLTPLDLHPTKPTMRELNHAMDILNALTILTALIAISMVVFGKVETPPPGFTGDLYQLIRPIALVLFTVVIGILFHYRKSSREANLANDQVEETNPYGTKSTARIWLELILAGIVILFAAESMVISIERFCDVTGVPVMIAGVLAGLIGCLGEMLVVHNYSINPKGRLGDAIVGVAMDNIVTILGATIVAIIGGIFLGGNSLILIFVIIFALNSILMWQTSKFKDHLGKLTAK